MNLKKHALGKRIISWIILSLAMGFSAIAQSTNSIADQNVGSSGVSSSQSASLFTGAPGYGLPIYTMVCGSLSLPISLSYSYNGLQLNDDASWVGLGWNLNAGGVVSRIVQDQADGSRTAGHNYGEYSIKDSLQKANNTAFFANVYTDVTSSFDVAPDVYNCSFNGYNVSFYWYNNKAYFLTFNKDLSVSWPGGVLTITDGNGIVYSFAQTASVSFRYTFPLSGRNYVATYCLTSVISADKKDTIALNYGSSSNWAVRSPLNHNSYVQGTYVDDPPLETIDSTPSIVTPLIQSIICRNSNVVFVVDVTPRADQMNGGFMLREIDVRDSISKKLIKRNFFSYEYFRQTTFSPQTARLKLKTFSSVNPSVTADSLTYRFAYMQEYAGYPGKGPWQIDDWGYYNGLFSDMLIWRNTQQINRKPVFSYCSYGALDTIYYPSGGFKAYQYELNDYDSSAAQHHAGGPGIRVKSESEFIPGSSAPASATYYSYLADDGTSSSGSLRAVSTTSGPITIVDAADFNKYVMGNNNPGSGVLDNIFYYNKVTVLSAGNKDKHRTDYYFKSFSDRFEDVDLLKKIDYRYDSVASAYSKASQIINTYDSTADTTFLYIHPYIDSSYSTNHINLQFAYAYTYDYNNTYWRRLREQLSTEFDKLNDSVSTKISYNYNAIRNMDSTRTRMADSNAIITKYKYADDYTQAVTGGLITHHVINPLVETQTWLQHPAGAPAMVAGSIVSYDTTIFQAKATYVLEPSAPLTTLNNETLTTGKYNTLLSDNVNYILKSQLYFDANNNLDHFNKASDITGSNIYDYKHSLPVAEVTNASGTSIAYTSFESDNNGGWTVPDATRNTTDFMTGKQCYQLVTGKTISASFPSGVQYVLSYWSTTSVATVTASGVGVAASPAGLTKSGWTYHEHIIPTTASTVSLTAANTSIDELRLHPVTAQMTTYTYDPSIGKTSVCSPNNMIVYYEYDGFNRIKMVKDMDRNVIKLYDYQYKQGYTWSNALKVVGFVKNNCACGLMGSATINYTVAANTYTSHAGQWDADQLALNDVNANGQNNANNQGTCVAIPCTGEDKHIINCTVCETGTKIYTSSVWVPAQHAYLCTYHYVWSNGATSPNYTEYDHLSCLLN